MTEGTIKTSRYEIIAIFREELRKHSEIEVFFNNKNIMTQLTRVDFAEFHIVHSDSGKIEFCSSLKKSYNSDAERGNKVSFALPECIHVVQRRRDPRFRLHHRYDFFCRGRHRNGENYLFDIKDISDGGCALIAKSPNLKFLTHSSILKNSVLWTDPTPVDDPAL